MPEVTKGITIANIATLKATDPTGMEFRKVTELNATYGYVDSFYVWRPGATYTEALPGIVASTVTAGFWVMCPSPIILNSGDATGTAAFPGIVWINTTTGSRFISNPNLTWSAIAAGTGASTTTTTTGFTQPSVGSTVTLNVGSNTMFSVGQYVYIADGGNYLVTAKPGATQLTVQNTGQVGNAPASTSIATGKLVTPSAQPSSFASGSDLTLTGNITLTINDQFIQYLQADTTPRTVNLPVASTATNKAFVIRNIGSTYNLSVTDGILAVTVAPNASTWVHCNGTVWREIG